jgi:hypothetical protein
VAVIAYDEQSDLALLKIPSAGSPRLELGEFSQVRPGLPVVALGKSAVFEKSEVGEARECLLHFHRAFFGEERENRGHILIEK